MLQREEGRYLMNELQLVISGLTCFVFLGLIGSTEPLPDDMTVFLQWSEDILLSTNPLEDRSPSFIQDDEGTIWVVWVTRTYTGRDILYKTFDGEWSKGMRLTASSLDDSSPSIMQDTEGTIWVVWTSCRDNDWEIYYKMFDGSWGDDIRLTESPGEDKDPAVFEDADGTVWVAWSSLCKGNYDIYYKTFDGSWSENNQLTDSTGDDSGPVIFQDTKGTIWVVWRSMVVDNWEIHYKTFDGSWSKEEQLYTNRQTDMGYSILLDTTGTIWFMWDSLHEDNYDIYYKTFDGEWSDDIQLTTAPGHDYSPSIFQDAEGTIWVVWDSERIFGNRDIYYKTFNGKWSDDIQLTEYSGQDWSPHIFQDAAGTFWVFWNSERDENQDIYYKTGIPPVPWWYTMNVLLTLVAVSIFFPLIYAWYKKFPISFNRFANLITRGKFVPFARIVPNPYIAGNPIRSKKMFFGRDDVFEYLNTRLKQGSDVAIVLHGQRRTGKTSILYQINEGRLGSQFIPVYIDFQAIPTDNYKEFLSQIAKFMMEALECFESDSSSLEKSLEVWWKDESDPYIAFGGFLDECSHMIKDKSFLILFDEFEILAAMTKGRTSLLKTRGFFRNWMQNRTGFSFIFAGTRALEKIEPFWSGLFDSAIYRKISHLEKGDALVLMKKPVDGLIQYDIESREEILKLTRCNPYLLQVMLQNLVDRINKKRNYRVTLEDVQEVVSYLMINAPPHFNNLWENSENSQKKVLSAMASFPIDSTEIPHKEIYTKLKQIGMKEIEIKKALEELKENDILDISNTKNTYFFELELFRLWITFNHPFSRVQEGIE